MHGLNGMGWGMGFGWVFGILVVVAIIWFIVRVTNTDSVNVNHTNKSALDILNERYANGEISREEYEEKKRVIS